MQADFQAVINRIGTVLLGKPATIKLAVTCLLARGHLLIEDLPGMGKTTLAHALARVFDLEYGRIQFTSDLLPADILGVSSFDTADNSFQFHPGPIFNQLILADEINRTTPKTQSALLEAMEERQVTAEGETRALPEPFFVIATQNPTDQAGTFPLPESQLDRFLMRVSIGYPDQDAERALMEGEDRRAMLSTLESAMSVSELMDHQRSVGDVHASDALLDYIQRIVRYSRESGMFSVGLSPRGTLSLLTCARSWAYVEGRSHVVPEDVQAVLSAVVGHRLHEAASAVGSADGGAVHRILHEVDVIG